MIIDAIKQGADPGTIIGIVILAWVNGFCMSWLIFHFMKRRNRK